MNSHLIVTIAAMFMGIFAGQSESVFRTLVVYYMVMIMYRLTKKDEE